jgi:hypothetical protein
MALAMTKEQYYELITETRAKLATDACRECSCPKTNCEWHGDCYTCVRQHRINGNHIPNCLQFILDEKVAMIAEAAEMTVAKKPGTPSDYWDYVRERDAEGK